MSKYNIPNTMKAWQYTSTEGGLEKNMKINPSATVPKPKPTQHLVRILAAALNPVDYKPAELPLIGRLLVPNPAIPCVDFAGIIITPASNSSLKAGQLVFGVSSSSPFAGGALAEFNVTSFDSTAVIPEGLDPVLAAGIGVAGLTAYQSIVPKVKKGDWIFINGGSGGTGVFGIQIAKAVGCHVTTTCSTPNVELCKSLGADDVIDYKAGSVISALKNSGRKFDHVVDNVCLDDELNWRCHEFMKPDAVYVRVGGVLSVKGVWNGMKRRFWPRYLGGFKGNVEGFWPKLDVKQLECIAGWMRDGTVRAVVDTKFPFEEAPRAFEKLKTGRARGKIVVDVAA